MNYINITRKWIKDFVIQLKLCPFARDPFEADKIRYALYEGTDMEALTFKLLHELQFLQKNSAKQVETTVVIVPNCLKNFHDYLDFLAIAENILVEKNWEGIFQIASFHPHYQFANTEADDVTNYTNRSPFPMFHLLREESVAYAIEEHPLIEAVPKINIEKMKRLGRNEIEEMQKNILDEEDENSKEQGT